MDFDSEETVRKTLKEYVSNGEHAADISSILERELKLSGYTEDEISKIWVVVDSLITEKTPDDIAKILTGKLKNTVATKRYLNNPEQFKVYLML